MSDDKKKTKRMRGLILFAGLVCLGVIYSKEVYEWFLLFVGMLAPFLAGAAIAFVLNLPMNFIEGKVFGRWQNKKTAGLKRGVSILLSVLFVILILGFVIGTVMPQLTATLIEIGTVIPNFVSRVIKQLEELVGEYPDLRDSITALENISINWGTIMEYVTKILKDGVTNIFTVTVGIAGSIAEFVFDAVIAFVFAIYILTGKETLKRQIKKLICAYLPDKWNRRVLKVSVLCGQNFAKFITGQCLEAVILGSMFVLAMTIFRMPYAVLVGVLIAFTALIPIVGAFIGCIVGAFLILMISPMKALGFIVLFLILQQIEGNLIYPRVVGNSVGLPALWVLLAVSVGGSMFGIVGMLVFIPIMSTVYTLIRENVNNRLGERSDVTQTEPDKITITEEAQPEKKQEVQPEPVQKVQEKTANKKQAPKKKKQQKKR